MTNFVLGFLVGVFVMFWLIVLLALASGGSYL